MVTLPRRLAAVLIALFATLAVAGTALGSPRDVINDFLDNGVIDVCHPKADYDGARKEQVQSQYGDFQGALDTALANAALVGTTAAPCPAAAETPATDDDGGGNAALIAIPIVLIMVALALVLGGRRRREGADEGDTSDHRE